MLVIDTKIAEVQAFRGSAVLTRMGKVFLKKGENRFYLTGAFRNLDAGSIRFWYTDAELSGAVQLLDRRPSDDEEVSSGEDAEIISRERELELIKRSIADRKFDLDVWMEYTRKAGASADPEGLEDLLKTLETRRKETYGILDELEMKKREAENELRKLRECEDERRKAAESPCLEVRTFAEEDTEARFRVEYRVTNAGWDPSYELVIDKLAAPYTVLFKGSIRQNTGEDWRNVQVTFSGTEPQMSFSQPSLRPVYLGIRENPLPKPRASRHSGFQIASMEDSDASFGAMDFSEESMPFSEGSLAFSEDTVSPSRRLTMQEASTIRNEATTEFLAAGRWDIPGDGRIVSIDIKSYESEEGLTLTAYPFAGNHVWYETKLPDEMRPELLGGMASVYIERAFFGKKFISPDSMEDDARLTLGNDRQILVQRRQTRREKSKVMLRSQEKTLVEYETAISNRRGEAVDILVYDRVPVSKDNSITVTVSELSGGKMAEEREGVVCWQLHLEGGEQKKLVLSYQITFPAGKTVREN